MKGVGFGGSTQEESSTSASRFWMLSSLTPIRGILKMVQIVAEKHVYLPGKSNEANTKKTFLTRSLISSFPIRCFLDRKKRSWGDLPGRVLHARELVSDALLAHNYFGHSEDGPNSGRKARLFAWEIEHSEKDRAIFT